MCKLCKNSFLLLLFLIVASHLKAQTFFRSVYDHEGPSIFWGAVKQNNDSVITFMAKAREGLTIAKLDTNGNFLSAKKLLFESCNFYDHDFRAVITPDSSITIASSIYYEAYTTSVFISKLDKNAQPVWVKSITGPNSDDVGSSIKYTSDNGFVVAGERWLATINPAAAYLVKVDSSGDVQWAKIFNRNRMDEFYDVEEHRSRLYSVGSSDSIGVNGSYGLIIKTDMAGNTVWTKGLGNPLEVVYKVVSYKDSLIVSGQTRTQEPFLCKLDTNGNLIWTKVYHFDQTVYMSQMIKSSDGGFILSGSYGKQHTSDDFGWFVLKTDDNGNILWCKIYGGKASYYVASDIQELPDKSLLSFAKYAKNNGVFLIYKSDSVGNCPGICELTSMPTASSIFVLDSAIVFDEFFVTVNDSAIAYTAIKDSLNAIDSCDIDWVGIDYKQVSTCQIFPNPVSGILNINLPYMDCSVYISDLFGHVLYENRHTIGTLQINTSAFTRGIYICTIATPEKIWHEKVEVN